MRTILSSLLLFSLFHAFAQQRASVAFWNAENLYDTIPSLFYDDGDYSPGGRLRWAEGRYEHKLHKLAAVIDGMAPDIVGLCEVESEQAVREMVTTLRTDYCYIHRTTNDARGMDIAMLYKGDRFFPDRIWQIGIGTSRSALYVRGELCGRRVDIITVHMPSQYNRKRDRDRAFGRLFSWADSLQRHDPGARVVIMGDMNAEPDERSLSGAIPSHGGVPAFFNPLAEQKRKGRGSYMYRGRWLMYDNIVLGRALLSSPVRYVEAGVYIREHMIERDVPFRLGYPSRTFSSGVYSAGASDHLPVFMTVKINSAVP